MKLSARRTGNGLYSIAAGVVLLLFSTHVAAQTPAVTSAVPTLSTSAARSAIQTANR
jgi:hypothetical protein